MKTGPVSIRRFTKAPKKPTESSNRRFSDAASRISLSPFPVMPRRSPVAGSGYRPGERGADRPGYD